MPRRGENIRKRSDGRWEARIIVGYDAKGKASYRSIYGKTYAEVREKRNHLLTLYQQTRLANTHHTGDLMKATFGQLSEEWIAHKKESVKESTYSRYSYLLDRRILPVFQNAMLSSLSSEILDSYLKELLVSGGTRTAAGLSPKSVTDIRSVLLQILEYGKEHGYPYPVTTGLFYPKNSQGPIEVLSSGDQKRLVKELLADTDPLKLGILLTLYSGLRIGEACALTWGDIDLTNGTLRVNKTLLRIQNTDPLASSRTKVIIAPPKTDTSNRYIPLPTFLLTILESHQRAANCYVLTGTDKYLEPRTCLYKYKHLLEEANLMSYSYHALRHTFATNCVENEFDSKSLSEILGHSNVVTTMQRYVHPSMTRKREQMERLPFIQG